MDRRTYLAATGSVLATALAGCTSTGTTDTATTRTSTATSTESTPTSTPTTSAPPSIKVTARDAEADDPDVSLDITYSTQTQWTLPTDPETAAQDGNVWLVLRMDVTNTGDSARDLRMYQYVLAAGGEIYEPNIVDNSWALADQTVDPGETVTGWVAFYPPTSLEEGELRVRENTQAAFDVSFSADESLDAQIPE